METWFRLPGRVRVAGYAAACFSFVYLALLAWDFDRVRDGVGGNRLIGWGVVAILICLLSTSFVIGLEKSLHRNFGSFDRYLTYRRALRSGELPADIEPDSWDGWLNISRTSNAMARLISYLVLLTVVVPGLIYRPAYHPEAVILLGLLVLWRILHGWRKSRWINRLASEIRMRPGAQKTFEQEMWEREFRRPLASRMIPVVVVGFGLAFGLACVDRFYNGSNSSTIGLLLWAAVVGLVPALSMLVGNDRNLIRNFGSLEQHYEYSLALKTGELPADIDQNAWRAWLRRSRRLNRMGPVTLVSRAVLAVLPSLFTHSAYWVTALALGALEIMNFDLWWRRRAHLAQLTDEVERRTPGDLLEGAR